MLQFSKSFSYKHSVFDKFFLISFEKVNITRDFTTNQGFKILGVFPIKSPILENLSRRYTEIKEIGVNSQVMLTFLGVFPKKIWDIFIISSFQEFVPIKSPIFEQLHLQI